MLIKIAIVIFYSLLTILLAHIDAVKIRNGIKIKHGLNGLYYILMMIPAYLLLKNWLLIIGLLAVRRIVFDTALNLFRGLKYDYISATTTSIIDRLSYGFQKKYGYVPYYLIFFIIILLSIIIPYGKT